MPSKSSQLTTPEIPVKKNIPIEVACPECGHRFEPTEALSRLVHSESEREIEKLRQEYSIKETALINREQNLKSEQAKIQGKVDDQVKLQLKTVQEAAQKQAEEKLSLELRDLKEQVNEKNKALNQSQEQELQLRKRVRDVEEKERQLTLEVERQVQNQLETLKENTLKRLEQDYQLKLLERDKQIRDIKEQLEAAKRTALQGSQQTQGEAVEEALENQLRVKFPTDRFEPVPKGIEGADLIQSVRGQTGTIIGTMLWEFKNTKSFNDEWVNKLLQDQRQLGAHAAILVSKSLPKDASPIEVINGVFVVSLSIAIPFAITVRKSLEELSYARAVTQGQDEKTRIIYSYLTGPAFKQKMMSIVQAFQSIKEQLDSESVPINGSGLPAKKCSNKSSIQRHLCMARLRELRDHPPR